MTRTRIWGHAGTRIGAILVTLILAVGCSGCSPQELGATVVAPAPGTAAAPTEAHPTVTPAPTRLSGTATAATAAARTRSPSATSTRLAATATTVSAPLIPTPLPSERLATIHLDALPVEAQDLIRLIGQGGPFQYKQDGAEFQNRERLLPQQPSGYYREYTVETPGSPDRGARRIVRGASGELYYTDDHYVRFRRVIP